MLKHSMSASDTFDMLRILKGRGYNASLNFMDNTVKDVLEEILEDIKNNRTFAQEKNSDYMKNVTDMYFCR